MALFGFKNNAKEYLELSAIIDSLKKLLSSDVYLSRKMFVPVVAKGKGIYEKLSMMEKEGVLSSWCKNQKTNPKLVSEALSFYAGIEEQVKKHNEEFVARHLRSDKAYLDGVLKDDDPNITLDKEQRTVVLSDEDYTLVVAGAGAGKTTTIEAKAKYLVDKQGVDPERILIVSFTKKATDELKTRFKKLAVPAQIATFHSIGNTIIKDNEETRHQIVSNGFMFDVIKDYLMNRVDDELFIKKILLFFASYLSIPFDEENTALLYKQFRQDNTTTLRSDLTKMLDEYQREQTQKRKTLNDERVRSIDECRIANFLFIHGVDYEYEPIYRYGFKDTIKPYCPDFLIRQFGKEVYLEHFGISESGENNRFTPEELSQYKRHVNDKIKLHREHGTKLIYTFSRYNDGRDLVTHLKEELMKAGISLETKTDREIYRQIAKNAEDKYFTKFVQLVCTFLARFKVNNFTPSKFDEWKISLGDERTKLFVEICYQCYLVYTQALKEKRAIDFEDMINNASNVLDQKIAAGERLPYDYIFVDEYQDISLQRFDLAERLSRCSDAKIIAVGDDWQSIFRFSGAQIDLFTKFEEKMGYANVLKITKTYRNSQELIDIAGGFVMENAEQIQKSLHSEKRIKDPVILMTYDDAPEKGKDGKGPFARMGEAIEKSLDQIVADGGEKKSVLLIGRYNFDGRNLARLEDHFEFNAGRIISKKYPKLHISFLTAHSAKGLGYDNVVVINGKDDVLGFPSKIEDDPVMKLVIKDDESIDFAEERRLFYVALTRTKNRVYIVTPEHHPSKFILEIKDKFTNVILRGVELTPEDSIDARMACPMCGYPLQRRRNKNFKIGKTIYICSNDPEVCGFMTNDLKGGRLAISKCPSCEDGYLVVKAVRKDGVDTGQRILGCTNHKPDGTGCSFIMRPDNFSQDRDAFSIRLYGDMPNLSKVTFCGVPFKDMVNAIIDVVSTLQIGISPNALRSILIGDKENKTVERWRLDALPQFGMIDEKYGRKYYALFNEMKRQGIVTVDEADYNKIKLLKPKLEDGDYVTLFSEVMARR